MFSRDRGSQTDLWTRIEPVVHRVLIAVPSRLKERRTGNVPSGLSQLEPRWVGQCASPHDDLHWLPPVRGSTHIAGLVRVNAARASHFAVCSLTIWHALDVKNRFRSLRKWSTPSTRLEPARTPGGDGVLPIREVDPHMACAPELVAEGLVPRVEGGGDRGDLGGRVRLRSSPRVPLEAFVRSSIWARALSRYRREWAYARHCRFHLEGSDDRNVTFDEGFSSVVITRVIADLPATAAGSATSHHRRPLLGRKNGG